MTDRRPGALPQPPRTGGFEPDPSIEPVARSSGEKAGTLPEAAGTRLEPQPETEWGASRPARLRLSRKAGFRLQEHSLVTNGLPAVNVARPLCEEVRP